MNLPHIGRPSKSGLSVKLLGRCEYSRRLYRQQRGLNWDAVLPIGKQSKTGLSVKVLGEAEYVRQWRKMKSKRRNP